MARGIGRNLAAVQRHAQVTGPLDVLATFGGFEIAMMTGAMLKAAELRKVLLIDGFIVTAALLVAARLQPAILDYCVFSHSSGEHGHALLLEQQKAFNAAQAGRQLPVLFEKKGRHAGQLIGRSPYLQSVHVTAPDRLLGQIVTVKIEAAAQNSLAGALALEAA